MIASTNPGWKPLTGVDQREVVGDLLGAFLTTFDPPEPGVLIEDYLPVWFGLEGSDAEEGADRLRYFAELEDVLRRRKGQLAIVSSCGETATSAEAWIWNYIHRFEVGARGPAVQHAKLWMFHRASTSKGGPETLEIVISSANLTRAGLRGQIQAAWRCVLPLDAREAAARAATWGVLPGFLAQLGQAGGAGCIETVARWAALLRRCTCPAGTEIIASVPGTHPATTLARKGTAWGAAGLAASWSGRSKPSLVAMAPTVGAWKADLFRAWARRVGVEPERVSIAWVRTAHPWAGHWQLDPSAEKGLTGSGVRWLEVPVPSDADWTSPLCDEHQSTDPRWSHAKLYELHEGTRSRLLITSANLSCAAWGSPQRDGGLAIDNFELGVLLSVGVALGDGLGDGPFDRATGKIDYRRPGEPPIAWLAAKWDGAAIMIECRTSGVLAPLIEVVVPRAKGARKVRGSWRRRGCLRTRLAWPSRDGVPVLVRVSTRNGVIRQTAVNDVRPPDAEQILCSEYDEAELREELDRVLEEKYGYTSDAAAGGSGRRRDGGAGAQAGASYAVPAYVDSRRRFQLVDNWWQALGKADPRIRPFVIADGRRILAKWSREAKVAPDRGLRLAARVAADELAVRLRRV